MSEKSIHGHAILHHIEANGPIPRTELATWAYTQFGDHGKYHACFADNMDLPTLLEALEHRGKITETHQGFVMGKGAEICDHG